jgi:hypothetical protein
MISDTGISFQINISNSGWTSQLASVLGVQFEIFTKHTPRISGIVFCNDEG